MKKIRFYAILLLMPSLLGTAYFFINAIIDSTNGSGKLYFFFTCFVLFPYLLMIIPLIELKNKDTLHAYLVFCFLYSILTLGYIFWEFIGEGSIYSGYIVALPLWQIPTALLFLILIWFVSLGQRKNNSPNKSLNPTHKTGAN